MFPSIDSSQPRAMCLTCAAVNEYVHMCTLWVFVSLLHASVCVSSELTGVCTLCLVSSCVGGLALAVTCVVLCALSLSPCATYLFVAHLPDTSVCQQREKQSAGNWWLTLCRGGERINQQEGTKERLQGTEGQQDEGRKNRIRNEELGWKWGWARRREDWIWKVCRDRVGRKG